MHTASMSMIKRVSAAIAATAVIGLGSTSAIAASANVNTNLTVANDTGPAYGTSTTVQPGDIVNLKVFLQNSGDATGTNPRITDTLDSHLSYVAGSSIEYTKQGNNDVQVNIPDSDIKISGQSLTWGFSSMDTNPSSSIYLVFQARVADSDQFNVGETDLTDQATSSFDGVSLATNTVGIDVTKSATQAPAFADRTEVTDVTKNDQRWYGDNQTGSVSAGDTLEYRVVVTNTGNVAAQNVAVKAVLPAGLTFAGNVKLYDDNNNGTAINDDSIVNGGYVLANLPNGNDHAATITFEATTSEACTNASIATGTQIGYNGQSVATDSASVIYSCTDGLIITKQVLDPSTNTFVDSLSNVTPGEKLTYRIEVLNNGTATVNDPTVRDALAANETFVPTSLTIDGESMIQSTVDQFFGQTGMILTNLTPGLGKQIEYQVTVGACAASVQGLTNTAYVYGQGVAQISATVTVNESTCATTPTPAPTATPLPSVTPTGTPIPVTSLPQTGPEMALLIPGSLSGLGLLARKALKQAAKGINVL